MKLLLRLDYATFNFDKGTASLRGISEKLLGEVSAFCWTKKGLSENAPQYSPLGLRWMDNSGYDKAPHKLQVSGVGCDHFEGTLPALRDREHSHFSRLDFAYDVLTKRDEWKEFIKAAFASSLDSERLYKRYRLSGNGEAMTIYIGDRKGAKFFRIYNKTLENPKYEYVDPETGVVQEVPEDCCVIRYEVELHRHKRVSQGQVRLYDPSEAFDWYYDSEKFAFLEKEIKALWLSYGDDILLPPGFEDAELVAKCSKNKNFASKTELQRLEEVREKLHDYPHTFDHTLAYIADRFGKYIPYLLADPVYRDQVFKSCEIAFGFAPDLIIEPKPAGWYDLDAVDDTPELPWIKLSGEQIDISEYEEGGECEWS